MSSFYRDTIITKELRLGNRRQNIKVQQIPHVDMASDSVTVAGFNALITGLKAAGLMERVGVQISGTATDSVTATPIANAVVQVLGATEDQLAELVIETVTDESGEYALVLKNREYKTYTLNVFAEGYEPFSAPISNIDGVSETIDAALTEVEGEE